MSNQLISSEDLKAFLDDIQKNINNDDNTDFKKLILYLFNFTNSKILNNDFEMLDRLFNTIELVLGRRKSLLNLALEPDDVKLIHSPPNRNQAMLLYEWSLLFCLNHVSNYSLNNLIINQIKAFIIKMINLITTGLNNYKYIKQIKVNLIEIFEFNLNYLFKNLIILNSESLRKLFVNIHLFSILNDYDISTKLNLFNHQLKFESYSRKLWFLLNESMINDNNINLANNLRSILILNLTNNLSLNFSVTWNQISLVLEWLIDYIKNFKDNQGNNNFNKSIAYSLLKIFMLTFEKGITENFINCLNFKNFLNNLPDNLPHILTKSLHLINYHYNLSVNNYSVINSYQLSIKNQYNITPFNDYELDSLRLALIDLNANDNNKKTLDLLSFLIENNLKFNINGEEVATFNYLDWLNYIKSLIQGDLNNEINLEHHSLYSLVTSLGYFPCLFNNDFSFKIGECLKCGNCPMNKNFYDGISPNRKSVLESNLMSIYYKDIICNYLLGAKFKVIKNDPLLCCNFLLTIFKIFTSFKPPKNNLNNDLVFNFVIEQLKNHNNRDVRLLCSRILPLYLIQPKDKLLDSNFKLIFKKLNSINFSDEGRKHFAESTIKSLVELSIISNGEWSCVLFIKLIDLFGESNDQHVNYVYNGFLNIASAKSLTPYKLLSPFLPSVAERIIKQPRMFNKITELLGVTKKYFLYRTKDYTTPRFLEYYKHDFIQEIADASNISKWKLIAKNLSRIIATYLVKDDEINETYIINVLSNVSPEYKSITMTELISNIGEITWFILLQIQIDEDNDKFLNETRILNALKYIAKINLKQKAQKINGTPEFDNVTFLLGEHVLELVQRFSENVHQIKGTKPYLEKVSSLRAIQFLINKNINSVTTALGQISTCLQASLENPDFELLAIKCWYSLVQNLPSNHLISLLDIMISLIFQKFKSFENRSKEIAIEILKIIFKEIRDKYDKFSLYYLSIPFINYIQDYNLISEFKIMKPISRLNYFKEFTRRLSTNNSYVVQQALDDLINYLTNYQLNCQDEYFKDPLLEDHISELMRTLLDTSSKFKNKNKKISTSCAKVLSIIGSLDSNKFNFKSIKHHIIVINDFNDFKENSEFLIDFIENKVLKIFWASNDPVKQLFSAYSMQKFLQVMKLDPRVLNPKSQDYYTELWNRFSDVAKSTLTPLLSSKYISPVSRYEPIKYPYYNLNMKYENWLINFSSNLLKRPVISIFNSKSTENSSKEVIFRTFAMLIRDQDISLCQYILKYITLSHIISGDEEVFNDIKIEFLHILYIDSTLSSPDRIESLKSCYQSIFEVLDYLNEWVSAATQFLNDYQLSKSDTIRIKKNVEFAQSFLDSIPMDLIAIKSAECDSYERTIFYLEECYRDGRVDKFYKIDDLSIVTTLQSMYSNINDFDALNGILKKFSTNNLNEKLITFQYNENWSLAQESFHVLSKSGSDQDKIKYYTKLLRSLSDHGLYDEVLSTLASKIDLDNLSTIPLDWSMVGLQASVISGDIDQINKWLYITNSIGKPQDVETLINYEFAKGLKFLFESNLNDFNECMINIYKTIGSSLAPSASSSFSRNSYLMNQLHIIYDLSLIVLPYFENNESLKSENEIILKSRISNIDQGFDTQWKILAMHRVANTIIRDNNKISDILLYSSSIARKNERLDISTRSIMKAMNLNDQEANIEYTELLWAQGKQTEAIKSLSEIIADNNFKDSQQKSKVQLQYAEWLDESNHSSSSTIISEYSKVFKTESTWEKPYYDLGKYYNKIMESKNDTTGYYEHQIVRHFLKALALGNSFIFEALPKFITIWLDFAQRKGRSKEAERKLNQIISDIEKYIDNIQMYVWYTSITQILSRIVHNHQESAKLLYIIISKIIKNYPRHSLWFVLSHLNSNDSIRSERISNILKSIHSKDQRFGSIISNARELFQSLIKIANFKIHKKSVRRMSLSNDFKVSNLINPYDSLVIPVRSNLEIRLPAAGSTKFSAFPKSASITFDGFDDNVNIFHSLQMPRQVTIRGSDYQAYRLMIKKDDTRKDAKVVEFTTMINRLLSSSNEARKRSLSIANYYVVPLAENMGVIEFVQNVATMKSVISDQRRRMGQTINERKLFMKLDEAQKAFKRNKESSVQGSMNNLIELFEKICQENPPVLYNWFINQFSDPTSWYLARNSFTRSSAVMSIVGYIIGLGDRHCENILFFKKNGSVLHIDFDCLFEKGKTLPTPEIVPFRLTQNMIDAMGITGIEGTFRITCEVTGSLLRENEAPLMNILETLLYDPLLDWKTQQNPQDNLRKVRRKIRGLVDEKEGLPMNIHGQVDILIQESSSVENLSQMYGGWAPYI